MSPRRRPALYSSSDVPLLSKLCNYMVYVRARGLMIEAEVAEVLHTIYAYSNTEHEQKVVNGDVSTRYPISIFRDFSLHGSCFRIIQETIDHLSQHRNKSAVS